MGVRVLAKALALEGARDASCRADFNLIGDLDQASSVLSWFMRRRWGRLAILLSLRVKDAALRAVPGSPQAAAASRAARCGDDGVADEFWAQHEAHQDSGPSFGGFGFQQGLHQ